MAKSARTTLRASGYNTGAWTEEENRLFWVGWKAHGKGKWSHISDIVKTRSPLQVKSRGQKVLYKIKNGEDLSFGGIDITQSDLLVSDSDEEEEEEKKTLLAATPRKRNSRYPTRRQTSHQVEDGLLVQRASQQEDNNTKPQQSKYPPRHNPRPSRTRIAPSSQVLEKAEKRGKDVFEGLVKRESDLHGVVPDAKEATKKRKASRNTSTAILEKKKKKPRTDMKKASTTRKKRAALLEENKEEDADNDLELNTGLWTDEEHRLFLKGLQKHGEGKWTQIATSVPTRSPRQVADHAMKFFRTAKSRGEDKFDESELEEEDDDEEEEDEEESNDDVVKFNQGAWTDEEARLFLVGLRKYGKGKWVQISRVVKTRSNAQVNNRALVILKRIEAGEDVFDGLVEYDTDFCDAAPVDAVVETVHNKRGRAGMQQVAPTVSGSPKRKRTNTAPTKEKSCGDISLMDVLSAPCNKKGGVDASVSFSPLLCISIDKDRVIGCERLEKCGCVMDVVLNSSTTFLLMDRLQFAVRRRLEDAYKTRRCPTSALNDAIYRLVCQQSDDLSDILAACDVLNQRKSIDGETVFGEDEVEYWTERSSEPKSKSRPLREFALLRRLALPMCTRTRMASRPSKVKAGRDSPAEEEICFPDFSFLDMLLRIEITQAAVIDALMLRILQLENVAKRINKDGKPMVRDLQRILFSSVNEATGIKCADRVKYVSSVQFMLIVSKHTSKLKKMAITFLSNQLSEADLGSNVLVQLEQDAEWFDAMVSSWNIPVDRIKDWRVDPMSWTRVPVAAPPSRRSSAPRISNENSNVEEIRQVLLGERDVGEWLAEWGLQKLEKKADMLVGRNDGSSLTVTSADMSQETFLIHTALMDKVNDTFPRLLNQPGARPRMQALDISDESLAKIHSMFFDMDGSLREDVKRDVEMSTKHGYINFQNTECAEERNDKRWQLPIKQHTQVRIVKHRAALENELQANNIISLKREKLDDVGMLIGGTEDQSLHHDVSRVHTRFVSKAKYDPKVENPIAGWEVGRIEYNEAMTSEHAPCSILLGMGSSRKVLLGVQKDQIERTGASQCTIIGGTGQVLDIVEEREDLVVLEVEKGVMFSGDFPHAGVRNVPQESPENDLLELLNNHISEILENKNLTQRQHLDEIVDMLCKFPNLDKLCRLFCSTEQLDGKMKNQKNAVGFSDCLANAPGRDSKVGSSNTNSESPAETETTNADRKCASNATTARGKTDEEVASKKGEEAISSVTPTYSDGEEFQYFSSPVMTDVAISPLATASRVAFASPRNDDDNASAELKIVGSSSNESTGWAVGSVVAPSLEGSFDKDLFPWAGTSGEVATRKKEAGGDDGKDFGSVISNGKECDLDSGAGSAQRGRGTTPSPPTTITFATTFDEVKAKCRAQRRADKMTSI